MYKNAFKYDDVKRADHMSVRTTAGWYRFTHQLTEVSGPDALAVLEKLYCSKISGLKAGKNKYTFMLNDKGEIIDDVIIICQEEDKYWISNLNLMLVLGALGAAAKAGSRIQIRPITSQYIMYSVQGPKSLDVINALTSNPVDDLKFFTMEDNFIDELPVKINRAGFTGEKFGYEIYIHPDHVSALLEKLRAVGPKFGTRECMEIQMACWTWPCEKGLLLIRDLLDLTPMDAGLERYISWDKEFTGKEALLALKDKTPDWEILGFTLEEENAFIPSRHYGGAGAPVFANGEEIGQVAKFVYSYVLEKNIGLLLLERGKVKKGDHVAIRHADTYDAVVTERVFI